MSRARTWNRSQQHRRAKGIKLLASHSRPISDKLRAAERATKTWRTKNGETVR